MSCLRKLFVPVDHNSGIIHPLLVAGAVKMREKLCTYAHNQLEGVLGPS